MKLLSENDLTTTYLGARARLINNESLRAKTLGVRNLVRLSISP